MDAIFEGLTPLYLAGAVLVVLLPVRRSRMLGAAGLGVLGLATASDRVAGAGGGAAFATVNKVLAAAGVLVMLAALLSARRRFGSDVLAPPVPDRPAPFPDALLLLGLALAAAAPHLLLLELGVLLALIPAGRSVLPPGRRWWAVPLLAGAAALGTGLILMLTILGQGGGPMATLADGPFSPPAERLLMLLLGGGALLLAGVPPLHRSPWGRQLAPLGAILLLRIGLPVLSLGVADWQPLAMLLLALGGIAAAVQGSWAALAVAGGLAALWSGSLAGGEAAALLVLWGWLADLRSAGRLGALPRLPERWAGLPALVPAWLALPALEAALSAQVLLSVVFVAGAVLGFVIAGVRRSRAPASPLY